MKITLISPFGMNACTRRLFYFTKNLNRMGNEATIIQNSLSEIREADSDIFHILKPHLRSAAPAKMLKGNARMLLDIDDFDPQILREQNRDYETMVSQFLWDMMIPKFSTIITSTGELKNLIGRNDATVINNGVDTSLFRPVYAEIDSQLAYCGGLGSYEQVSQILYAFKEIHKEYPEARLKVIGDGKAKDSLVNLAVKLRIWHACIFTGNIPYGYVPRHLANAEVLIDLRFSPLSARMASPGMKGYEYMAMGKPIISPKCEVFNDENAYPVASIEETKEAFASIMEEPRKARGKARKAREEAVEKYDWKVLTKKLMKVYRKVSE